MKHSILGFSLIFIFFLAANATEPVSGNFNIRTNGNACLKPEPLAKCIVLVAAEALGTAVGPASSEISSDDNEKLLIPIIAKSVGLFTLQLQTADVTGWEEGFENISDNNCELFPGPARQVYHSSKSIFRTAKIYPYKEAESSEKARDIDLSTCLEW